MWIRFVKGFYCPNQSCSISNFAGSASDSETYPLHPTGVVCSALVSCEYVLAEERTSREILPIEQLISHRNKKARVNQVRLFLAKWLRETVWIVKMHWQFAYLEFSGFSYPAHHVGAPGWALTLSSTSKFSSTQTAAGWLNPLGPHPTVTPLI